MKLALVREALRALTGRVRPIVVARDALGAHGEVVTLQWPDPSSPSGQRWQTVARFPDGRIAERRWADHTVDAEKAHEACVARHRRRTIPSDR